MTKKYIKHCLNCSQPFEAENEDDILCPKCQAEVEDLENQADFAVNEYLNEDIKIKTEIKNETQILKAKINPQEIKKYLDKYIIGQDQAKKVLSVAIFNHIKRLQLKTAYPDLVLDKSNVLIVGPSGSGKTHLIKTLAKLFNIPYCICDATSLTESGYVGADVETVLQKLYYASNENIALAEKGIVFIDEIDKKASKNKINTSITRDVSGEGVQQALLKLIEGNNIEVQLSGERRHPYNETITINTENILFIMSGAFPGIDKIIEKRVFKSDKNKVKINGIKSSNNNEKNYNELIQYINAEDIQNFGLIPEFIGRLPVITYVNKLTEEELCRILTEPKNSIVSQYQTIFESNNKKLEFQEEALKEIAKIALKTNTGARNLRSLLEGILLEPMYNICDNNLKIEISENDVKKYYLKHQNN